MKYEQPYGISDPNASYINGNPSTGTMGSIPPAASIENPQREIVNFIGDSNIVPTDADLHQLSRSVQSGMVNYSNDTGPVNLLYVTAKPAVAALGLGLRFIVKVANANTSAVKVSVNGLPGVPLVHRDLTAMGAGEIVTGSLIDIAYDGANFQLLSGGSGGGSGQLIFMTAPRDVYVNVNTGNDALYDGSAAIIGVGTVGPFKTIQYALSVMTKYNLGGWSFNIHIADGIYAYNTPMWLPLPNGSGAVQLIGNTANPGNVLLRNTGNGSAVIGDLGGIYYCVGLSFTASVQIPEDNGNCIWCLAGTAINVTNCSFGSCPGEHLNSQGGYINIYGPNTITGNAAAHWYTGLNGTIGVNAYPYPALTIANPVTISTFIIATTGGQAGAWWSAFNNAGFVSGAKYLANGNGVVDSNGRGTSFLPGTVAGSLATGGQYL